MNKWKNPDLFTEFQFYYGRIYVMCVVLTNFANKANNNDIMM